MRGAREVRTVSLTEAALGIERQERRLAALGVDVGAVRAEVRAEVDAATEEALAMPMPDPASATAGVFCDGDAEPLGDGEAPWSGFRAAARNGGGPAGDRAAVA